MNWKGHGVVAAAGSAFASSAARGRVADQLQKTSSLSHIACIHSLEVAAIFHIPRTVVSATFPPRGLPLQYGQHCLELAQFCWIRAEMQHGG